MECPNDEDVVVSAGTEMECPATGALVLAVAVGVEPPENESGMTGSF